MTRWVDRMGFSCAIGLAGFLPVAAGMLFGVAGGAFDSTTIPLLIAGYAVLCFTIYQLRRYERRSWFVFGLVVSGPVALYVSMGLTRVFLSPDTLDNYPLVVWLAWLVPSSAVLVLIALWWISSWRARHRYRNFEINWASLAGVYDQPVHSHRRRGTRGYLIASAAAFAAALVAYVLLNAQLPLPPAAPSPVLAVASMVVPGLLGFVGIYAKSVHDRMAKPSAPEVLERGAVPPILVLRSFKDDEVPLSASRLLWWEAKDLIHAIAAEMAPAGPVIAFGNPLDRRPALGPHFHYVVNDAEQTWKGVVQDYVERAGLVVFCAGMTEHLRWEVSVVTGTRSWRDLMILFPPSRHSPPEVFAAFARDTSLAALHKILPENTIGILGTPGAIWLLTSDKRRLYDYRAAMIAARSVYRQDTGV